MLPNGLSHIEIDLRGRKLHYKPADFVKICVPAISRLEFHPFSIASCPCEDRLRVLIKPLGNWTSQLCKLLKDDASKVSFRLDGPFESPTKHNFVSNSADVMVVFAAGVGVSLYAGQIESWLKHGKKVEMAWVDRDFQSLQFLTEELSRAYPSWREEDDLHARVFCTAASTFLFQAVAALCDCFQEKHLFNPLIGLPVFFCRPDFDLELARLEVKFPQSKSFAVFCCGPAVFSGEIQKAVEGANARRVASWSFSPEVFEFSWT